MEAKLDGIQFFILVTMNVLGAAIIFIPSLAASYAKENSWITISLTVIIGLAIILLYNHLIHISYDKGLYATIDKITGKWFGKLILIIFMLYTFMNIIGNLWAIGDFISIQILMGTPFEVITFLIILTVLFAIRYGIEVIGRTAQLFFPFTILCAILLTLLVMGQADWTNAKPIFRVHQEATVAGILPIISITYLELFIMLGITHMVHDKQSAKKGMIYGGITSGVLLLIITVMCIAVLGVNGTANSSYPVYALGQRINLYNFFQRVEIIVAFIWFFTIFFKICVSYYILVHALSYTLKIQKYKVITIPLMFIIFFGSLHSTANSFTSNAYINGTNIITSLLVGLLIPILLLVIRLFRRS
ncbi:spore germination protein [Gracilibacillus caseinilyticus]|uniref:Spore germination protein n=1 Tax=Gracilibacillus caseinilyticus TaxID=2932256 RepID=A0ABY4F166_9BACI|nr:endospore germination permease [Gracilibacillus caseinilyticus]UOQ50421.1 spore germination protein [Gracilibacillus caseinilyticus]